MLNALQGFFVLKILWLIFLVLAYLLFLIMPCVFSLQFLISYISQNAFQEPQKRNSSLLQWESHCNFSKRQQKSNPQFKFTKLRLLREFCFMEQNVISDVVYHKAYHKMTDYWCLIAKVTTVITPFGELLTLVNVSCYFVPGAAQIFCAHSSSASLSGALLCQ